MGNRSSNKFLTRCILLTASLLEICCSHRKNHTLFEEQGQERTGITFQNIVKHSGENNVLNYPYYFNGGGVAVGDLNNDGLEDVYFTGNLVSTKLYLNKGDFKFEDITDRAGVGVREGWKTGVTMADVNQDGWIDIYVCRSAMEDSTLRRNLLFINNGDLTFTESARQYGVDDTSYSTHAAFFDYDKDGDLDLFVLNHSLPQYAGFSKLLVSQKQQKGNKFGSKLYQNNKGRFTDVSEKAGIINNVLSFGLGLAVSDLDLDGWLDLYISNDFNEEDYLYLNNRDGTFRNVIKEATGHVSLFSMGSDAADINNDALPDILTLDMLPETNERIKLSSGDDNYDKYEILIGAGFHHQSMRNMLQLNNGDGTFSEIGQLAGISNTDWSWAALLADFDGDGWKDVFITNGYEKDYTNMQFLKFTVDEQVKARQKGTAPDLRLILERMPSIAVGNYFFKNNGNLTFTKKSVEWGIDRKFKSNGAAYADLDNDGDYDLVINTMNEAAVVYRNRSADHSKTGFLRIDLRQHSAGQNIIGTKMYVYTAGRVQYYEFSPSRGFQSCMLGRISTGLHGNDQADSVRIVWPDNKTQVAKNVSAAHVFAPNHAEAVDSYEYPWRPQTLFENSETLSWKHSPPKVNDFKRQFMLPRMYSFSGPKIIPGDVNLDGWMDVYVCGPKDQGGALFLQQANGSFTQKHVDAFESDKSSQDEDAALFDADGDGDLDLYVVSGGYGFHEKDPLLQDRLYFNDGAGNFTRRAGALPAETWAGACAEVIDIDGDNDFDLFIGSRIVPGQYPQTPESMLLINDGKGNFMHATTNWTTDIGKAGMVCDAKATDINKDGNDDLIVVGEWMPVSIFINTGVTFKDETAKWFSVSTHGLWNCVTADDFDGDGDRDLIAGNYGLNNQFNITQEEPATLVYKDFNNDGQIDPFFCYFINGISYPYASRDEALGQVTALKTRFPDYTSYSNATLQQIFAAYDISDALSLRADMTKTVYLENNGDHFTIRDLPIQAQYAPVHAVAVFDLDHDGDKDLIMGGNESFVRVRLGRSDANRGFVFMNDGKGNFAYLPQPQSGLDTDGDVRQFLFLDTPNGTQLLVGQTGEEILSYLLAP